jgi:catalase
MQVETLTSPHDGFMRGDAKGGAGPNDWPNSFGGPAPDLTFGERPFEVSGQVGLYPFKFPNDDFVQPGNLYRDVMEKQDQTHLVGNIVDHLGKTQKQIQLWQTALFYRVRRPIGCATGVGPGRPSCNR